MRSAALTILFAAYSAAALAQAPPPPSLPPEPSATAEKPAPAAEAPVSAPAPTANHPAGPATQSTLPDLLQTRIEQVKRGNRVSEVRVTGPGGERRYTMENPQGVAPPSPQNSGTGLSTPSFLIIDF